MTSAQLLSQALYSDRPTPARRIQHVRLPQRPDASRPGPTRSALAHTHRLDRPFYRLSRQHATRPAPRHSCPRVNPIIPIRRSQSCGAATIGSELVSRDIPCESEPCNIPRERYRVPRCIVRGENRKTAVGVTHEGSGIRDTLYPPIPLLDCTL